MAIRKFLLLIFIMSQGIGIPSAYPKKIKHSLKVEKSAKSKGISNKKDNNQKNLKTEVINLDNNFDSATFSKHSPNAGDSIRFAGYEKEVNSSTETFLIVNESKRYLVGYTIRIIYNDLQGRMLHSRDIKRDCEIPPGESRKDNIPSWDLQHTHYYYLGNEPKKVSTPYKVEFIPLSFMFLIT